MSVKEVFQWRQGEHKERKFGWSFLDHLVYLLDFCTMEEGSLLEGLLLHQLVIFLGAHF